MEAGDGLVLPQNGLITTATRPPNIRCLSGSSRSNVGSIISPQDRDITFLFTDPFLVSRGGSRDPGTISIRAVRLLGEEDYGVYTYRTPDESNKIVEVHFGIYNTTSEDSMHCFASLLYRVSCGLPHACPGYSEEGGFE